MLSDATGRVLILDDDPLATRTLDHLLRLESRLDRTCFNDGNEALEYLRHEAVDAIVSDFMMPEMDGLAFLGRAKEIQPEASRILLTGYADKESAIRSINEIGLYAYLEKPWDNSGLLLVLRNAVERTRLLRLLGDRRQSVEAMRERLLRTLL